MVSEYYTHTLIKIILYFVIYIHLFVNNDYALY